MMKKLSNERRLLKQLKIFQDTVTRKDFDFIFADSSPLNLWHDFKIVKNGCVLDFWASLNAEEEVMFLNYLPEQ